MAESSFRSSCRTEPYSATNGPRTSKARERSVDNSLFQYDLLACRSRQTLIEVRQTFHFRDIRVVLTHPTVSAGPLPFPIVRIDERPLDLEGLASIQEADALDDAEVVADREAIVNDVLRGNHTSRIDDQRVAFPVPDGLAVDRPHDLVGRRVVATVEIDDAEGVHEAADHVDGGRLLDHRDRPHARHDYWHARRIALADPIVVRLPFLLRLLAFFESFRRRALEFRVRRTGPPRVEAGAEIDEPGTGQVERRLGSRLGEVGRRQSAQLGRGLSRLTLSTSLRAGSRGDRDDPGSAEGCKGPADCRPAHISSASIRACVVFAF